MKPSPLQIKDIIETGKLIGYIDTGGFLTVYWKTPQQSKRVFWIFQFSLLQGKLFSIKELTPNAVYGRWQAKRYVPIIEDLMQTQLAAINKHLDC